MARCLLVLGSKCSRKTCHTVLVVSPPRGRQSCVVSIIRRNTVSTIHFVLVSQTINISHTLCPQGNLEAANTTTDHNGLCSKFSDHNLLWCGRASTSHWFPCACVSATFCLDLVAEECAPKCQTIQPACVCVSPEWVGSMWCLSMSSTSLLIVPFSSFPCADNITLQSSNCLFCSKDILDQHRHTQ